MVTRDDEDDFLSQPPPRAVGVGDIIRDRFVLEEDLGLGGMGRVFKALDLNRKKAQHRHPHVALKLLTPSFGQHPASFMALQREATRAQMLAHPNIIRVFDFDQDRSLVYLVMEYLRGRTLKRLLDPPGFSGLSFGEAMQIIRPVCQALAFAHNHGIVHSDLKPSNIFLTDDGGVKVIDFGIARIFHRADAANGEATVFDSSILRAFSPLYASPEMIEGDEADPRDDIFSLACITYEMLSGNHPFGGKSAARARGKDRIPEKPPGLSGPQWAALKNGLAFSRSERTPSVERFLAGLERRPGWRDWRLAAAARTATTANRFLTRLDSRRVWKNQRRLAAGGALALALMTGLAWLATRSQEETVSTVGETEQVPIEPAATPDPPAPAPEEGVSEAAPDQPLPGDEKAPPVVPEDEEAPSLDPPRTVDGGVAETTPDQPVPGEEEAQPSEIAEGEAASPLDAPPPEADAGPLPGLPPPDVASPQPGEGQPAESEAADLPVTSFRDCDKCPEMVVVPAGRFTMGAPSTDPDAEPQEKRQREVAIDKNFALGRYEVTEREWQACVEEGVCRASRQARATDFPDHPRTHVNWWDARRFVRWLNQKTEQNYRLPTEEEWEYAARAGTATRYPWGDEIGQNNANCRDCGAEMGGKGTARVGSFAPNAFGLSDMAGNVWEWTAACSKSVSGTCTQRIVRGGSWDNSAAAVRVSQRMSVGTDIRQDIVGFRVARDMPLWPSIEAPF